MEDSWLGGDQPSEWVEVIDPEGEKLGWLYRRDAIGQRMDIQTIETPERYLSDPYVLYHAQLAHERGILSNGNDHNDVQVILLASRLIKQREFEKIDRDRIFEERFFTANPDDYRAYKEHQARKEEVADTPDIEQRVPRTIEEFLSDMAAFGADDGSDSGKEQEDKTEGWLSSFLDDSELDQMADDDE